MLKFLHTYTADDIYLTGLEYRSNDSKSCCILIPGLGGNYIDNSFINVIGETLSSNGINYIACNTRGSFNINYSHSLLSNTKVKEIGIINEMFNDCIYDIKAWIDLALKLGYDDITLMGHSVGCNKIIYFLDNYNNYQCINDIIFISPIDYVYRMKKKSNYEKILAEVKNNCQSGKQNLIVYFDYYYKYSYAMLDLFSNDNLDNFPSSSRNNSKFNSFLKINIPITILYGSYERQVLESIDIIKEACYNKHTCNIEIINNAGHSFNGSEIDLSNKILSIQKRR